MDLALHYNFGQRIEINAAEPVIEPVVFNPHIGVVVVVGGWVMMKKFVKMWKQTQMGLQCSKSMNLGWDLSIHCESTLNSSVNFYYI